MPRLFPVLIVWASLLAEPRSASGQDGFVVIVNQANPVTILRPTEVSKLFLRKQTRWASGQPVQPIDQTESSATRRKFSLAVHGMDVPSVRSFWQEQVFSGRDEPPPERTSDAEVVAYVKTNRNAVGYVSAVTPVDDVKVVSLRR